MNESTDITQGESSFADSSSVQMRKGVLVYCVLLLAADGKAYSSDIIRKLRSAELIVVEGTLYPLLSRLAKEGILGYEWQESEQGPPRKYYWLTQKGETALKDLSKVYKNLQTSITKLEKGTL